jgi:hypothetical protein
MSEYNPYQNQNDNYSPYEGEQPKEGGVVQAAFGVAKNMAAFGILNFAGRVITRGASRGIASFIAKGEGSLAKIAKSMASNGETLSLGGIFSKTSEGQKLRQAFSPISKRFSEALAVRTSRIKAAQEMGPAAGAVKRVTSAFSDLTTFSGTVGRAFKQQIWAGAGVSYAIDNALGTTKDMGLEKKALWDVPGQVGNFAKWMGVNSIYGLGFHGAAPITKALGGMAALGAKNVLAKNDAFVGKVLQDLQKHAPGLPSGPKASKFLKRDTIPRTSYGKKFVEGTHKGNLGFQDTVMSSLRTVESAVRQSSESLKNAMSDSPKGMIQNVRRNVGGPYKAALDDIKKQWSDKKGPKVKPWSDSNHDGLKAVEFLHSMAARELTIPTNGAVKSGNGMAVVTQHLNKLNKKKTLLEEILPGLKAVKNSDVVNDATWRTINKFVKGAPKNSALREFTDSVKNMRSGSHTYTGYGVTGGGVDLSMFDPLKQARRFAAAALDVPIGIPFTGFKGTLGSILHIDKMAQETPKVEFFPRAPNLFGLQDKIDENSLNIYVDGKFASYSNGNIHSFDWGRKLAYAPKGGTYRQNEQIRINRSIGIRDMEEANKRKANMATVGPVGKFLGFLNNRLDMSIPTSMKSLYTGVERVLSGKKDYVDSVKLFGIPNSQLDENTWRKAMPVFGSIREHAAQEMLPVMKSQHFLSQLGESAGARLGFKGKNQLFEFMNSDNAVLNSLEHIEGLYKANAWEMSQGTKDAISMVKAFPSKATRHEDVKSLGRLSGMTAYDTIRLGVIDDVFNKNVLNESGIPGAKKLLMVKAAISARESGAITANQEKAFKIHAFISQFEKDTGNNALTPDLLKAAEKHAKEIGLDRDADLISYIQSTKMRQAPMTAYQRVKEFTPYISTPDNFAGAASEYGDAVFNTVGNLLSSTFPFRRDKYKHFGMVGNLKYLGSSIAKMAAINMAYKAADAVVAMNPTLDGTALDDGITPFIADQVAKTRLATSRILDATGVTGAAKFIHGLMPGFESSAPGAIIGGALAWKMNRGGLDKALWFAGGAIANRVLSPFMPDFTKSYDQLKDEYSGRTEVPIMKNPTWLMGMTPWEGSKVIGWKPNWYVETKSRWKETDTMYGSTFRKALHEPIWPLGVSIGDFVDPYYMERKHYFSRPYPLSGGLGDEVPIIGPLVNATIGRIIKPQKTMHQEFLSGGEQGGDSQDSPFGIAPPSLRQGLGMMSHSNGSRSIGGRSANFGTFTYSDSKNYAATNAENFLYNVQEFAGLPGFLSSTVSERFNPGPTVLPTLETAGRIASQSRAFYDMNLGGLGIFTEAIRRIIPKPPGSRYGINPIPNLFPNWLPSEFLTGDAYSKLVKGELRLPGSAYESTHADIRKSMPARSSMIGFDVKHSVQYFTGLITPKLKEEMEILETGTYIHKQVQDSLAAEGLLVQAESFVYDVKNDISGHVDAIIKDGTGGGGKRALEIKSISGKGFNKLEGPKWEHVGQLNFYLKELKMNRGTILYINKENPAEVKTYEVNFSQNRYNKDMANLRKARQVSADVMGDGVNDKYGYSYSWIDRLKILADVAPTSNEYKEAKKIVQQQIKYGMLTNEETAKYQTALQHRQARVRQYDLYPKRFAGRIMSPDSELNIDSMNNDIKAAAEYAMPFRAVGAVWENFTNMNTFVTNKFFAFKDPLEHYKAYKLYGKEFTPWDEPYRSFIEPFQRKALSRTDPISAALTWGVGGSAAAGPIGGFVGGALGAMYGTVQGLRTVMGAAPYMPNDVKEMRSVEDYFDKLKFARGNMMADLSEGIVRQEYLDSANSTVTAFLNGGENVANLFKGVSGTEKPYLEGWLSVKNEKERTKILNYVSPSTAAALRQQWSKSDRGGSIAGYVRNSSDPSNRPQYNFDRSIMDPSMEFEDIKMKSVEDLGYNAHDFGLGWNDQVVRMQQNEINSATRDNTLMQFNSDTVSLNSAHVKQALVGALQGYSNTVRAQVYIQNDNQQNFINITVRRDKSKSIVNALQRHKKYRE